MLLLLILIAAFLSFIAIIVPFKPFNDRASAVFAFILSVVAVFVFLGANRDNHEIHEEETTETITNNYKQENEEYWHYYQTEDPMTSKKTYNADLKANDYFELDFPYKGQQKAELTLRTHPRWGKNAILTIERGQFLCRYDGCDLLIRFDDGQPIKFSANEPEDRSTTTLFINDYSRFAGLMLKAKTVKIQAGFYNQGSRIFEFNVKGFNVKAYRPN